ncbi:MAG TPA: ABC transporter substrate-binding protein [Chloroflexota bacterium]
MQTPALGSWAVALLVAMTTVLMGCVAPSGQTTTAPSVQQPSAPKRITVAMMGNPVSPIDRFIGGRSGGGIPGEAEFAKMVGSGLTVGKDLDSEFMPQLAEAVPSTDNGLWQTFADGTMKTTWKIRSGAMWHDGVALTSSDFLFTTKLEQDKDLPVVVSPGYKIISSIDAPDPQTITVTWKSPFITADVFFADPPIPQHILEQPYQANKDSLAGLRYWSTEFVGAGPYRVTQWVQDQYAILDAFDSFPLGRPKIDQIVVKFLADENAFIGNILAGEIDATLGKSITYEQAEDIKLQWAAGHVETRPETVIKMWPQFLDPKPAIMLNVDYRKALFYAINRQELVDSLVPGRVSAVANSVLLPTEPLFKDAEASAVRYEYDPRKAADLLQQIGYAKGPDGTLRDANGEPLTVQIQATGEAQNTKPSFAIADYWKRIGVAADVDVVPVQLQNDKKYRAEFPGLSLQGSTSGIPKIGELSSSQARVADNNYVGRNYARYANPEFDGLINDLFAAIPTPQRTKALQNAIHWMTDQVVMYSLYYSVAPTMISNRLLNAGFYPSWNSYEWDVKP